MRTYLITLTARTPLLMHHDNIPWADRMDAWKKDPKNRGVSRPGDDRTPPFRWLGTLYHDRTRLVMPTDNIMKSLMLGGTYLPTGRGQKTFKAQTQYGILAPDMHWTFHLNQREVPVVELLDAKMETRTWEEWNECAEALGFTLFLKRASMKGTKHIRVRPKFDTWSCAGKLVVLDESITTEVLTNIGELAGQRAGLGDWRPGSRTPGPWGMYDFQAKKA